MAVIERLRDAVTGPRGRQVPKDIVEKMGRGREAMLEDAQMRRLCLRFWRGQTYWYLNEKGMLRSQDTVTRVQGGGKPPHKIRNRYNYIEPIVQGKVSAATRRVPGYQILPSTTDPNDIHAAELSSKIALYGYDKWMLRRATIEAVTYAIVTGEGFLLPYFDSNVGPFIQSEPEPVDTPVPATDPDKPPSPEEVEMLMKPPAEPEVIGTGEIKLLALSGNEVYWEPGQNFYDSRWHVVERAMPIDEIEAMPGFVGGKIKPDAVTSEVPDDKKTKDKMALVSQYFERPSKEHKNGRRVVVCNGMQIIPTEDYPCTDDKGRAVDEPVLHRISWTVDPDAHRDRGLVEQLLDLQRTAQDCWNKLLEYKNRGLNPQMSAPVGSMVARRTDEPGAINFFRPVAGMRPEWEPPIQMPQELFQLINLTVTHMRDIGSDAQVQAEADVAARTVQAVTEQAAERWQTFLADLADFHGRVMRHCLYLVSKHYTEERLIQIQGDFGPNLVPGFRGSDLKSQVDVRVFPESLQPLTQEAIEQRATNWAQLGWIPPAAAMMAITSGTTEGLMQGYEQDVGRINGIIERIKQGPEALFAMPERWDPTQPGAAAGQIDPVTGGPAAPMGDWVPGWMPRPFDDVDVQMQVLTSFMKGNAFENADPGMQEAAYQVYEAFKQLQQQKQMEEQMRQAQMAEGLGMSNAARPQLEKPLPDMKGQEGTSSTTPPEQQRKPPAGGPNG